MLTSPAMDRTLTSKGAHNCAVLQCKSGDRRSTEDLNEHTDEGVMSALATAEKAFHIWAARPFSERTKINERAAEFLLEKKLARFATPEMGKRISNKKLILVPTIPAEVS